MKRGQIKVPATDAKGKTGMCDVLDLDDQSFRIFTMSFFMKAGWVAFIPPNHPSIRNVKNAPLMVKKGVSFALDKDKVK